MGRIAADCSPLCLGESNDLGVICGGVSLSSCHPSSDPDGPRILEP